MAANHTINETSSTSRARTRLIGLGAVLLLAASCSGGSDASATPTVQLTSTAPTTVATTTTTQATTTTEDPAIAHERDVAEITEVYGLLVSYHETHGVVADLEAMAEFAAEPLLSIKYENVGSWERQGFSIRDLEYDFRILETTIEGNAAKTVSCYCDGGSLVTADDQVVIPSDTEPILATATYERTVDGWRVTSHSAPELTPCDV